MFVISCDFNIPGVEDFRIRKFLSPRRKDAKFEEKTIVLLQTVIITILFSELCELSDFARDIPSFDCGCSPTGAPLFPQRSLGKSVYYHASKFTRLAQIARAPNPRGRLSNHAPTNPDSFLRPLRSLRPIFNSVAAEPRQVLRGKHLLPHTSKHRYSYRLLMNPLSSMDLRIVGSLNDAGSADLALGNSLAMESSTVRMPLTEGYGTRSK